MATASMLPEAFPARALRDRLGPCAGGKPWAAYLPSQPGQTGPLPEHCMATVFVPETPAQFQEAACCPGFPGDVPCAPRERAQALPTASRVKGRVWSLAREARGCREVQQALEAAASDTERLALAMELQGCVWEALRCPHANHVVQKCIMSMPPQRSQFILDELLEGDAARAAQHKYGCRIVQRLLEHLLPGQVEELREALLVDVPGMCRHPYGNYVMQHVVEHGSVEHRDRLVQELCLDAAGLGCNPHGAAVIAAALAHGTPEGCFSLARALAEVPGLLESMSGTRHGHLAVKRTICALEGSEHEAQVSARMAANIKALAGGRYGRVLATSVGLLPTAGHSSPDMPRSGA